MVVFLHTCTLYNLEHYLALQFCFVFSSPKTCVFWPFPMHESCPARALNPKRTPLPTTRSLLRPSQKLQPKLQTTTSLKPCPISCIPIPARTRLRHRHSPPVSHPNDSPYPRWHACSSRYPAPHRRTTHTPQHIHHYTKVHATWPIEEAIEEAAEEALMEAEEEATTVAEGEAVAEGVALVETRASVPRRRISWTWPSTWTSRSPSNSTVAEKVKTHSASLSPSANVPLLTLCSKRNIEGIRCAHEPGPRRRRRNRTRHVLTVLSLHCPHLLTPTSQTTMETNPRELSAW